MYMIDDHSGRGMTEKHSIADARRNLPKLIREAENGKTVELTRRGESVAVLIGHRLYERLAANRRGFVAAYGDFAETVDLSELDLDPDELFEGVRDMSSGRDVRM